jgi:hypothetical protein
MIVFLPTIMRGNSKGMAMAMPYDLKPESYLHD